MSHFTTIKTKFADPDMLLKALADVGFPAVERHYAPQPLFGYQGDQREDRAEIIIRRKHVGAASNDIGFKRDQDGFYQAIISEYDRDRQGFDQSWLDQLSQRYAYHTTIEQMAGQGFSVVDEQSQDGQIRLTLRSV